MKNKIKEPLIVLWACLSPLIIIVALFFLYIFDSEKGTEFCNDIKSHGWEEHITYPMLSAKLRDVIPEGEFNDNTAGGRLKMYKKLDDLVLDDRPTNDFSSSTHWGKTPCMEIIETDEATYYVEFGIDVTCTLGIIKVCNFTCHLWDIKEFNA